jgi:hypothetical protein
MDLELRWWRAFWRKAEIENLVTFSFYAQEIPLEICIVIQQIVLQQFLLMIINALCNRNFYKSVFRYSTA